MALHLYLLNDISFRVQPNVIRRTYFLSLLLETTGFGIQRVETATAEVSNVWFRILRGVRSWNSEENTQITPVFAFKNTHR